MPQNSGANSIPLEFHVSRTARDRYQFDDSLFLLNGTVIFANFHAARTFAQKMNQKRDLVNFPEQAVRAGQINAMGLIHETIHYMFRLYRQQHNPNLLGKLLHDMAEGMGAAAVDQMLLKFIDEFPPLTVYRGRQLPRDYLADQTEGTPNRELVLEELIMLWLENANPAFTPFQELFDDTALKKETIYPRTVVNLEQVFSSLPGGDLDRNAGASLLDLLTAHIRAAPHSLEGQLEYIRRSWGPLLGRQIYRLLSSLDLIKEEEKPIFLDAGPPEIPVYDFSGMDFEPERFSPDREWMPRLIMIAKNAYVWLDQMSKKYQRAITTLDQIPDEELDLLAQRGITGLWLIGLWERSRASERIKKLCGNIDAVASAYSLFDYQIADALGGEAACQNLRARAWQRGVRLASDMVPNHVGIDGRWVIEHPDWFISSDHSPFPAYTFSGPDLSWDERVAIMIEDHYYNRTDAAVVFKRVDRWSGREQYIYHGNDGTAMPWNDTAQLNYLNPEVREAVIQTILHVARQFPIIRFDAAMTLAKRHFQRLWFPEPGHGGAIPSRAEHGLTKAQFDALMPEEFWREVVDRAAVEAPDTLLLAEAFWLMEGYFVRTLGMHRVYNSAFMNILRDEDNAKYRTILKNTLEFDPEIMRRYVNFMNNPDEKTAVEQFGKGDKYFGICMMLVTMPGLPMIGHGQIEGFTEKYGMEYKRAYWDEQPDDYLVHRHEREIFPLLHRRYLFAGVEHFLLYDFFTPDGHVDENVFAYSNRFGDERGLIVYHNRFGDTRGWVRTSVAYSVKANGDERALVQKQLSDGLGLSADANTFCIFRDHAAGLEYIRSNQDVRERGLYVELGAYKYQVFIDFREVQDNAWHHYAELTSYLNGRGVPSIDEALKETFLRPIHYPFKELTSADMLRRLLAARTTPATPLLDADAPASPDAAPLLDEVEQKMVRLLHEIGQFIASESPPYQLGGQPAAQAAPATPEQIARGTRQKLESILRLPGRSSPPDAPASAAAALQEVQASLDAESRRWYMLLGWAFVHPLGRVSAGADFAEQSRTWIDEWLLGRIIASTLRDLGHDEGVIAREISGIKLLTSHQRWFETSDTAQIYALVEELLRDRDIQQLLRVNRYQGVLWFEKESFEQLLWWMLALAVITLDAEPQPDAQAATAQIASCYDAVQRLREAAAKAHYQVEKLLEAIQEAAVKG